MAELLIRQTNKTDIHAVASLLEKVFGSSIDKRELLWLLADPDTPDGLNSKVVTLDGELSGHVGFVSSTYLLKGEMISGVHATNLCVDRNCRGGGMGKKLFELVSYEPDVSVIYEGTPSAIRLYPKSGFEKVGVSELFSTTVLLPSIAELKASSSFKSFLKIIALATRDKLSRWGKPLKNDTNVTFNVLQENDQISHEPMDDALTNCPNKNKINWLKACPYLKSLIFAVNVKNKPIGILYLYIKKKRENRTGRIACMPNMGSDENYWQSALAFAERQLEEAQVRSYTIYASHPVLRKILTEKGFTKEHYRAIWVYDAKGKLDNVKMHLMHLEGDDAFRGV